jgi:excisionase family DNA binding protein
LAKQLKGAAALAALEERGDLFASPAQAAAILKLNLRTVYAALERGEIPSTRVVTLYKIPVAWLRQQASKVAA